MLSELIKKARSYRRFDASVKLNRDLLSQWIALARQTASARNMQPIRYLPIVEPDLVDKVFNMVVIGGSFKGWVAEPEERPVAFILILEDTAIRASAEIDCGIAAQTLQLAACEAGFGGVMLGSIDKDRTREAFKIPEQYEVLLGMAFGKPAETSVIVDMNETGDTNYYRGPESVNHVPKRKLEDLIIWPEKFLG